LRFSRIGALVATPAGAEQGAMAPALAGAEDDALALDGSCRIARLHDIAVDSLAHQQGWTSTNKQEPPT
jgi:hypothetical protein